MAEPTTPVQRSPSTGAGQPSGVDCSQTPLQRPELSYCKRVAAAKIQILDRKPYDVPDSCPDVGCTPDELNFPQYAASFHKLLPHDPDTGLLTDNGTSDSGVENYKRLLRGLKIDAPSSDFDSDALNGLRLLNREVPEPFRPRVLINPRSSKSLNIKGPDITSLDVGKIIYREKDTGNLLDEISLGSDKTAAEMVEVYAMALLRGLAFAQYGAPGSSFATDVEKVVAALNSFEANFVWGYEKDGTRITAADRCVTAQNLFRGPTAGDLRGDYLSVFLTFERPPLFPSGCAPHVADLIGASQFADLLGEPLRVPQGADNEFGITLRDYAALQNAKIPQPYPAGHFSCFGPLLTGRNLGDYVHVDNVYEQYIRATDILVGHQYPRTPHSPYTKGGEPQYVNEGDGPTLGPSDAYGLVGGVRIVAERASFAQKYLVARRARPEVMGALIHLAHPDAENRSEIRDKLSGLLFASEPVQTLLARVRQTNWFRAPGDPDYNTFLLSQMYPEGSPAHPAWPSGHATVAGACVTVLKAIFDDTRKILDPTAPPPRAGEDPATYKASNGDELTVGGELDKLASNVAFGRNFGGVHYRTDGEHGILLGEQVAIQYLQDHLREYREEFREVNGCAGFSFTKRNGQRICVTTDVVTELAPAAPKSTRIYPKSQL